MTYFGEVETPYISMQSYTHKIIQYYENKYGLTMSKIILISTKCVTPKKGGEP